MPDRLDRARTTGILADLRAPSPELALEASEAIIRGGVTGIEVTFSTPDAPAVIRELIARHGDAAHIGDRACRGHDAVAAAPPSAAGARVRGEHRDRGRARVAASRIPVRRRCRWRGLRRCRGRARARRRG